MRAVFGDHLDEVVVSATKAATGHLLGAAGAIEAVFTVQGAAGAHRSPDDQPHGSRPGDPARRRDVAARAAEGRGLRAEQLVRVRRPQRRDGLRDAPDARDAPQEGRDGVPLDPRARLRPGRRLHRAHRRSATRTRTRTRSSRWRERCLRRRRRRRGLHRARALRLLDRGPAAAGRAARRGRRGARRASSPRAATCSRCSSSGRRCATTAGCSTPPWSCTAARCSASRRSPTCPTTASSTSGGRSRRATTGAAARIRIGDADVPFGPDLLFEADRPARPRAARRDLRGHVGADPAERGGGARGRDGAREPLRQPDHGRPGRGPGAARPVGLGPLRRRLRLRRRRPRRVDDRPGLGRPDADLRERRAARRRGPLPRRGPHRDRRRRPRPAAPGADADGQLRRQPAHARGPRRRVPPRSGSRCSPVLADIGLRRAGRAVPVRARRRRPARAGLLRGLQHPGRRASCSGWRRSAARRSSSASPAASTRPRRCSSPRRRWTARPAADRHPRVLAAGLRHRARRRAATRGR